MHFAAVARSLKPLVGKNLSLTMREEFEYGKDALIRPIHIWVRDSGTLVSKQLKLKGVVRENEPPGTLVHFKLLNINDSVIKDDDSESSGNMILSQILPEILPPNTSPTDLILSLDDENDGEDIAPFTISLNKDEERFNSKQNLEIRTLSWLDYEKMSAYNLRLSEKSSPHDGNGISRSLLNLSIDVLNVNDNLPVFNVSDAIWRFPSNTRPKMIIGQALATDADGDEIVYEFLGGKKVEGTGCCVVVPQTGEIMLVEAPFVPTHVTIVAR